MHLILIAMSRQFHGKVSVQIISKANFWNIHRQIQSRKIIYISHMFPYNWCTEKAGILKETEMMDYVGTSQSFLFCYVSLSLLA